MGLETMRLLIAVTLLAAATSATHASSFETLGAQPPKSDPSFIVLGQHEVASVSIENLGVPDPVVIKDEPDAPKLDPQVVAPEASTPQNEPAQAAVQPQSDVAPRAEPTPMFREPLPHVIRGGMEGEAFSTAAPSVPADASVSAGKPAGSATAQPRAAARPQAPQAAAQPQSPQRPVTPLLVPQ